MFPAYAIKFEDLIEVRRSGDLQPPSSVLCLCTVAIKYDGTRTGRKWTVYYLSSVIHRAIQLVHCKKSNWLESKTLYLAKRPEIVHRRKAQRGEAQRPMQKRTRKEVDTVLLAKVGS